VAVLAVWVCDVLYPDGEVPYRIVTAEGMLRHKHGAQFLGAENSHCTRELQQGAGTCYLIASCATCCDTDKCVRMSLRTDSDFSHYQQHWLVRLCNRDKYFLWGSSWIYKLDFYWFRGHCSSVNIVIVLRTRWLACMSWQGIASRLGLHVAYPPCQWVPDVSFQGIKLPRRGVRHPYPYSVERLHRHTSWMSCA
jgi:hypothetical protein